MTFSLWTWLTAMIFLCYKLNLRTFSIVASSSSSWLYHTLRLLSPLLHPLPAKVSNCLSWLCQPLMDNWLTGVHVGNSFEFLFMIDRLCLMQRNWCTWGAHLRMERPRAWLKDFPIPESNTPRQCQHWRLAMIVLGSCIKHTSAWSWRLPSWRRELGKSWEDYMIWYNCISEPSLRWIMDHRAHLSLRSLNWSWILPPCSNGRSSASHIQRCHIINTYLSFSTCEPRHLRHHLLKTRSLPPFPLVVFVHMHPTRLSLHSQVLLYLKPTTALHAKVKNTHFITVHSSRHFPMSKRSPHTDLRSAVSIVSVQGI